MDAAVAAQLSMSGKEHLEYDDRMDGQTELRDGLVVAMADATGFAFADRDKPIQPDSQPAATARSVQRGELAEDSRREKQLR